MTWRSKTFTVVASVVGIAVAARVIVMVLTPLLPAVIGLIVISAVIYGLLRGPHSRR